MDPRLSIVQMTVAIVSAFVAKNTIEPDELPALIRTVYVALSSSVQEPERVNAEPAIPAVALKKSITTEYLICLEDGKKFRSLRRHLLTHHSLTPDQYRTKWNLPADYPMVSPGYAATRSRLAKEMGLGMRESLPRPRRFARGG
jgi:predicted transcriptional regulator